jgi:hypothetical protein
MDPNIAALLSQIPGQPPRSKLEPHSDVIAALRKKRFTYRKIAQFLHDHLALDVSPSTIHDFIRVRRSRGKRGQRSRVEVALDLALKPSSSVARLTETADDLKTRIAAIKRRPISDGGTKSRFVYNEAEPLKLTEPATAPKREQES